MNILRDVAGGLYKMFVADMSLAIGILIVVLLSSLMMRLAAAGSLLGGAVLFLGCIAVLVASILLTGRRHRARQSGA